MKTLQLTLSDHIYDTLLAMLKGLPEEDVEIKEIESADMSEKKEFDINQFAGKISCFKDIEDPVAWQKEIRSEWDRK